MLSNHITDLARRALTHLHAGTTDQAPQTMRLPVDAYLGPERFRHEFDAIFLRRPQALMLTVELPEPGDYVARPMLGKPLLVVRGKDGVARIFLNVCRHRGAQLCKEGQVHAPRFACPDHNWTYDREGKLVGISGKDKFGAEVGEDLGLTELPAIEAAGVIWGALTRVPRSTSMTGWAICAPSSRFSSCPVCICSNSACCPAPAGK